MITIMQDALLPFFDSLGARPVTLGPGEALFRGADPVRRMYLVARGRVSLIRHTHAGASVRLQIAGPGMVLAEASAYSSRYHCDAFAEDEARLMALPRARFLAGLEAQPELARAWSAHLARQVQTARMRAEIRTLKTVEQRLEMWLAEGNALPGKGQWQELAAELGVSREALYRELARRRG